MGGIEINTKFTKEVICPYCSSRQSDSCELKDYDEYCCDECENYYSIIRHTEIAYRIQKLAKTDRYDYSIMRHTEITYCTQKLVKTDQ